MSGLQRSERKNLLIVMFYDKPDRPVA